MKNSKFKRKSNRWSRLHVIFNQFNQLRLLKQL